MAQGSGVGEQNIISSPTVCSKMFVVNNVYVKKCLSQLSSAFRQTFLCQLLAGRDTQHSAFGFMSKLVTHASFALFVMDNA